TALVENASSFTASRLPGAFSLHPNVPNPFNPSTTIGYTVPEGSGGGVRGDGGTSRERKVSLEVFNLRGRLVKTLVSGLHVPGCYAVNWEGTNEAGHQLPSGVYFYRMKAGDFMQTRKMVLLK
ncbi:MAG: FlgD immunoglobulin-like domain containing protein, partial [Gemmatimonadota bacterium]|nr:FlgD immunoglobulin-like domain containing protein [Gemmatimonadota bacterium]